MKYLDDHWPGLFSDPGRVERWQDYARRTDEKIRSFLQFEPETGQALSAGEGKISGVPFAVKDNIAVNDFRLTCGSGLLEQLESPYTATAIKRLQAEGGVVVGKTNLDEFGMGSSTENSYFGATHNPWDLARVPGGSSGGSAAAVASGVVPFALGSDTGGSVRQPAAFCGVYGLKPTYGTVSRFGLVAYASSLEVIGVISKRVATAGLVFSIMRGQDPLDHSSLDYPEQLRQPKALKVGIPAECRKMKLHEDVRCSFEKTLKILPDLGFEVKEIALPSLEYVVSAYYVIAMAEASANLARFDGIRYGARDMSADNPEELVILSRSRGLGEEVRFRILLGTYVLRSGFQDQYYLRAQKIRTAIRSDFELAFSGVDLILMPVYPYPPFKTGSEGLDPFTQKLADIFTSSANLAGLPAMSFPASMESGLPIGMQFLAPPFGEELLFRACSAYESRFPAPDPPLYSTTWSD